KRRNIDDQAGLELRGLHHGARRSFLDARLGVDNGKIHSVRQQDANGLIVVILDFHRQVGNQVILRIADDVVLQRELLVILGVHEVVALAIAVEILELHLIHHDLLNTLLSAEAIINHRAAAQVAHARLHRAALIARRPVVHAVDDVQISFVLDDHAGAQKGSLHYAFSWILRWSIPQRDASAASRPAAAPPGAPDAKAEP